MDCIWHGESRCMESASRKAGISECAKVVENYSKVTVNV